MRYCMYPGLTVLVCKVLRVFFKTFKERWAPCFCIFLINPSTVGARDIKALHRVNNWTVTAVSLVVKNEKLWFLFQTSQQSSQGMMQHRHFAVWWAVAVQLALDATCNHSLVVESKKETVQPCFHSRYTFTLSICTTLRYSAHCSAVLLSRLYPLERWASWLCDLPFWKHKPYILKDHDVVFL